MKHEQNIKKNRFGIANEFVPIDIYDVVNIRVEKEFW